MVWFAKTFRATDAGTKNRANVHHLLGLRHLCWCDVLVARAESGRQRQGSLNFSCAFKSACRVGVRWRGRDGSRADHAGSAAREGNECFSRPRNRTQERRSPVLSTFFAESLLYLLGAFDAVVLGYTFVTFSLNLNPAVDMCARGCSVCLRLRLLQCSLFQLALVPAG